MVSCSFVLSTFAAINTALVQGVINQTKASVEQTTLHSLMRGTGSAMHVSSLRCIVCRTKRPSVVTDKQENDTMDLISQHLELTQGRAATCKETEVGQKPKFYTKKTPCLNEVCAKVKGFYLRSDEEHQFVIRDCWDSLWKENRKIPSTGCRDLDFGSGYTAKLCVCDSHDLCNSAPQLWHFGLSSFSSLTLYILFVYSLCFSIFHLL